MISLRICSILSAMIIGAFSVSPSYAEEPAPRGHRLAVLIVFDQMRGDYLSRWETLFGPGGFRRMATDGVWFQKCNYPYAVTVTAAGHASISTGTSPYHHGIIANDWYDRAAKAYTGSVSDNRYKRVFSVNAGKQKTATGGSSPQRLLAPTVGDALKIATQGRAKVIGISLKDRAAILMAGKKADACYWFDTRTGTFMTSTYYRTQAPSWLARFNNSRPAAQWFGHPWNHLRADLDYARCCGPDDVVGEGQGLMQGRTFPHDFPSWGNEPGRVYYSALTNSPLGNELLFKLAEQTIDSEKLGQHDVPDLLCISFSSNDLVGHCWGPDSQEVFDITLRSDRIVERLLKSLDAKVGKDNYVVVLTADHGVCPLPEVARKRGKDARRLSGRLLSSDAQAFLANQFGAGTRWIEATADPWIYLNQDAIRSHGLKSAEVEKALAGWLQRQPGILTAYTRSNLVKGVKTDDAIGQRVLHSFYPARSGDVIAILEPFCIFSGGNSGTTHGTPHQYDTHVPLLAFGSGIHGGIRNEAITPQASAVLLAKWLGIAQPAKAESTIPSGIVD